MSRANAGLALRVRADPADISAHRRRAQIGVTPKVQIVDGQRWLTTIQLFLAAPREVAKTHKHDDVAGNRPIETALRIGMAVGLA